MAASVANTGSATASSGTAAIPLTVANAGDLIVIFAMTGSSRYVTSISDTFGSSLQTSVLGTFGTSSSNYSGVFEIGCFYGYAGAAGSDAIVVTWNGTASTQYAVGVDVTDIASSNPLISNIVNNNTSTTAVTVAGGSGSDTIGVQPALAVGCAIYLSDVKWTPEAGWLLNYPANSTTLAPYSVISLPIASVAVYDAAWTISSAETLLAWQVALAQAVTIAPSYYVHSDMEF